MILLRLITWPYIRRHLLRTLLTLAGIVLGVAVLLGMHLGNQAVLGAFNRTVDKIAGATQLQVSAGDPGFDEEVLERVQALPGVRIAVPVIEAVVDTKLPGQGNLLILGVDMTGDRGLRDYDLDSGDDAVIDDPLVFLAQPDSIMITRELASRARLDIGSRVPMDTIEGRKDFIVRGIMKSGGMTSAFGGNIAVMDIYAVQHVFGRGRKFDRIDLAVKDGHTVDQVRASVSAALGPGFTVETPSGRSQQFEKIISGYTISMNVSSLFALLIGMFIIYNSFAIAVTQRRYEIGILRALGATRGQIRTLFLTESAVAGLLGSAAGAFCGVLMGRGILGFVGDLVTNVYGVAQAGRPELNVDPRILAAAMLLGVVTSMIAALVPARDAAQVDPIVALQKGKYHAISERETVLRRYGAAVFVGVALLCLYFGQSRAFFYLGFALTILGALLMTPALSLAMARLLRPLLRWLRTVEGTLAADSLIQAPRRTAATVAALMLSLAIVIGSAGAAETFHISLVDWMKVAFNPDLFVTTSQDIAARQFRFPASLGESLRQVEGVEEIQQVRAPRIIFRGTPIMLISVELESIARHVVRKPVAGDFDEMYRLAAAGQGVIAADNLANLKGLKLGDTIELAAPSGILRLPIVGIVEDYSDQQGSLFIDREVFKKHWNDDSVNIFRIYLKPGVSVAQTRQRILERFGNLPRLFVLTNEELRKYVLKIVDQWQAMSYAQIFVAVFVAVLGIVNTLTVSITDRRRELGVLQAVGGLRQQVRHTIWMEAVSIGLVGVLLGLALGAIYEYYALEVLRRDVAGLRLDYVFPMEIALLMFPVILGVAFVASLGPAESAVRGSLVEALEYE